MRFTVFSLMLVIIIVLFRYFYFILNCFSSNRSKYIDSQNIENYYFMSTTASRITGLSAVSQYQIKHIKPVCISRNVTVQFFKQTIITVTKDILYRLPIHCGKTFYEHAVVYHKTGYWQEI